MRERFIPLTFVKKPAMTILPSGCSATCHGLLFVAGAINEESGIPSALRRKINFRCVPGLSLWRSIEPTIMIFPSGCSATDDAKVGGVVGSPRSGDWNVVSRVPSEFSRTTHGE
jgi:hypothetical protein